MKFKKIRPKKRKFKDYKILYIFLLFLFIGVGYAALTTSLAINGTTNVATNSWNIHFANLYVQYGSVEGNPDASISGNALSISYGASLAQPGDFYEFSVDVKNEGTLPGKVSIVNLTGNNTSYLNTSYAYSNGQAITVGDILNAGKSRRLTIKAWIPSDIDTSLLPTVDTPITLTFNLQYIQSEVDAPPDATDQIIALAKNNSCMSKYNGQVTDKVGVTEQANNVYFDKCADKRNVIFNNMCWQVIRTTETGGIKMIHNGEPEGGKCLSTRGDHTGIVGGSVVSQTLNTDYLYGNSFTYDISDNSFTLNDTFTETWSDSTYKSLLGKYTCMNSSGICTTIYNVSSYIDDMKAYAIPYTITSTNYAQIGQSPFNISASSLSSGGYMYNYTNKIVLETGLTGPYKFGSTFTYDENTNMYSLSGTIQDINDWSTGYNGIANTHFTCWNDNGNCRTISYVIYTYYATSIANGAYFINLINGKSINDNIVDMLSNGGVNKYNSNIKGFIEGWYSNNMLGSASLLENTVFCNEREIYDLGSWDPNGGIINKDLDFKIKGARRDLSCLTNTNQFSVDNNNAKLMYSIALPSQEEFNNLNQSSQFVTGYDYWTMTPSYFSNQSIIINYVHNDGTEAAGMSSLSIGVRPVISLAPGNTIASGTGSEDSPWVIQE